MVSPKEAKSWATGINAVKKEEDVEAATPHGRFGEAVQDEQGATKSAASHMFQSDEFAKDIGDVLLDSNHAILECTVTKKGQDHDTMGDSEGNNDHVTTSAEQKTNDMTGEVPPFVDLVDDSLPDAADLNHENNQEVGATSKKGVKSQKVEGQEAKKKGEAKKGEGAQPKKGEKASTVKKSDEGMAKKGEGAEDANKGEGAEVDKKGEGTEMERAGSAEKGGAPDDAEAKVAGDFAKMDSTKKMETKKGDGGKANKGVEAKEGGGEEDAKKGGGPQAKKGERSDKYKASIAKKRDGGMAKKVEGAEDAKKGDIAEIEKAGNAKKGGTADDAKAKAAEEQAELDTTNEDVDQNAIENPTGDSIDLTTLSELINQQRKKRAFARDHFSRACKG